METAGAARQQTIQLLELRESYTARLKAKTRARDLLDQLFMNPYMTMVRAAQLLNVSPATARQAVLDLQQAGILEEITGRKWGRLYVARSILDAIETT